MPYFIDDFGIDIRLALTDDEGQPYDVTGVTTKQLIFTKPGGDILTKTAVQDGVNVLAYTTEDGDIDEAGVWTVYARIAGTGYDIRTALASFEVLSASS